MSPLESRKQLLIAESEINRAQLLQEWQTTADGVRGLAGQAKSFTSIASSAALLVAGLLAFRPRKPVPAHGKSSWFQVIVKVVRLAGSIWLASRTRGHDQGNR